MNESPRVLGNRYEVGDLLGRGGMAEVHLGRDTRLGRVVAVKLLRTDLARDPTFQARFRREAQSAAGLNHPAIVAVYDTGEEQVVEPGGGVVPLPYIVMEYVEGRTLRELLRDGQPIDVGLALDVTAGVLSALEYSHRAGIVHRDIKPANVMLTPNGDVKVMDFGIARALADASATMTQTQAVIGTAQYLSPEQARGETVDARSDLYSAGCLLFELVTGRPPFVADSPVAVAYQHVREQPPVPSSLNPAVPEDVDRIILHALAKDRESRYQTAQSFRGDIDAVRSGRPVEATVPVGAVDPEAATQYLGAAGAGTRAMPPVNGGPGGPLLPGLPAVNEDEEGPYPARREMREEPRRKRGLVYALVGLGVLLAFGALAFVTSNLFRGPDAPKQVGVPSVVNLTEQAARDKLTAAGFKVAVESTANQAKEGTVVDQNPDAEQLLAQGGTVTITVSAGPKTVRIPQLLGLTQEDARKELEDVGLQVGSVRSENVKGEAERITRSDPAPGTTVAEGREVDLFYASGNVPVPRLFGNDIAEAQAQLQELGLTYTLQPRRLEQIEPGKAAGTNPAAGTLVKIGSTVILYVAEAPVTPTSPSPSVSESPSPSPSESPSPDGDGDGDG